VPARTVRQQTKAVQSKTLSSSIFVVDCHVSSSFCCCRFLNDSSTVRTKMGRIGCGRECGGGASPCRGGPIMRTSHVVENNNNNKADTRQRCCCCCCCRLSKSNKSTLQGASCKGHVQNDDDDRIRRLSLPQTSVPRRIGLFLMILVWPSCIMIRRAISVGGGREQKIGEGQMVDRAAASLLPGLVVVVWLDRFVHL
jgi:hypothetical protein